MEKQWWSEGLSVERHLFVNERLASHPVSHLLAGRGDDGEAGMISAMHFDHERAARAVTCTPLLPLLLDLGDTTGSANQRMRSGGYR